MKILRGCIALVALAFASTGAVAGPTAMMIDDTPFHATPDIVDFVLGIAGSTAQAPGDRPGERVVTLGRNAKNELGVTSLSFVADGQKPVFPAGTVAVMIVRHQGECQPPHGKADADNLMNRIYTFVVDYRGDTIWELGYAHGTGTFWQVKSATDHGPEEVFNLDPAKYTIYPCEKYE